MVLAESPSDKAEWLKAITSVAGTANGEQAPVWMADIATKACLLCNTPFTFTNRRVFFCFLKFSNKL